MAKRARPVPGIVKLWVGIGMFAALVLAGVLAPVFLLAPANALTGDISLGPSLKHLLGTNDFGQDSLARALVATRLTLLMSVSASAIAVAVGLVIGLGIWAMRGRLREVALRLLETAVAYPTLVLALIIAAILRPGVLTTILAIGIAGIPAYARVTVNLARSIDQADFVTAARLLGVPPARLAVRHVLPNMAEPLLVFATTVFAVVLVEISALSFIGLGVQSPDYDFGRLLNESLPSLYTHPIQAFAPSAMIVFSGIAMLLIGDALAERSNPRLRSAARSRHRTTASRSTAAHDHTDAVVQITDLRIADAAGEPLVRGASIAIGRGEVVGLVGESGSGKSLTAMAAAGLLAPELCVDAGTLRVSGMDMLAPHNPARLAREVSVIYQDPGSTFNPALRMGSQLTEVLRSHMGLSRREARATTASALESVGITEPARRMRQHPYQWSGGMRQRAMIAAGMANSPRLIIADEPTTALDVTVQLEVLRQLRGANEALGTSILFISHDIGVVTALCDRVYVMRRGEVVEELLAESLARGEASHPYTLELLAAVPQLDLGAAK